MREPGKHQLLTFLQWTLDYEWISVMGLQWYLLHKNKHQYGHSNAAVIKCFMMALVCTMLFFFFNHAFIW